MKRRDPCRHGFYEHAQPCPECLAEEAAERELEEQARPLNRAERRAVAAAIRRVRARPKMR